MFIYYLLLVFAAGAASQRVSRPTTPICYRLQADRWSPPLGGDSVFHVVPAVIRLDTLPATHGGWRVEPNNAFLNGAAAAFPGTPRWLVVADSIEIVWSNGYAVTTVRLGPERSGVRRGTAVARSDAVSATPPHTTVHARLAACPSKL
jgi:hypothetical protein